MTIYKSRPTHVEAIQWTGDNLDAVTSFGEGKVRKIESKVLALAAGGLELLAGKDGAQEWVPVPVGHWLVCQPNDKTDIWPVDPDYFAGKYDLPDQVPDA